MRSASERRRRSRFLGGGGDFLEQAQCCRRCDRCAVERAAGIGAARIGKRLRVDLAAVIRHADGGADIRLYHKPFVTLIWLGCLVMGFGAVLSLFDRRLRVGAPRPARMRAVPAE